MKRFALLLPIFGLCATSVSATPPGHSPLYTFLGDSVNDTFGFAVSDAGDVNGDGFADVIVGAPSDDNGATESGSARVLSGMDGSILYTFNGDSAADHFGGAVAGAGDVNGDGFADLIVGAAGDDVGGTDAGSARVLSGLDGSTLHTFHGDSADDGFGRSVAGAGDVDGDGFGDLIVGAPQDDSGGFNSGAAYVFSGATGSVLFTFLGTGSNGSLGESVDSAGDVNGDGLADLVVGAHNESVTANRSGTARVYSGADGSVLYSFHGDTSFDFFGVSVSGAGDVDADGYADVIIGANGNNVNGVFSGSAYVHSGADGSLLHVFHGDSPGDQLGASVSGAGDVDGDGFHDLIAGARQDDNTGGDAGSARVFSGADGSILYTFEGDSTNDNFGTCVSGAGDVNADGLADLLVGTPFDDDHGTDSGSARVFASDADVVPPSVSCPNDFSVEATNAAGATVTFTGSSAATAIDDRTTSPVITYAPPSGGTFSLGTTSVTVTAEDEAGNTSTCSFDVTVVDTTAPDLVCPGTVTVEATSASGASVVFTGAAAAVATDAVTASPTITYAPASGSTFALGTTSVTVTAEDEAGNTSTCSFDVIVVDTTAPTITSVSANPSSLWPPNNKMRDVIVSVSQDDVIGGVTCQILSVTSDEAEGSEPDSQITGALTLQLRAERDGGGDGRTYTITVRCTDGAGNSSEGTTTVTVPQNQGS